MHRLQQNRCSEFKQIQLQGHACASIGDGSKLKERGELKTFLNRSLHHVGNYWHKLLFGRTNLFELLANEYY